MSDFFAKTKGGLIVSCQALEDEPLYSSFIMGRMALAAELGGANGLRANTVSDIIEIKSVVKLPIIGIIKRDYSDSDVFITSTINEVDELMSVNPEMIAVDATSRSRPYNENLASFVSVIKSKYPNLLLMADIATLEDAIFADKLKFDCVSTTLHGYTKDTKGMKLYIDDFKFLKDVINSVNIPVIAEGNVETPEMAKRCLELGCHSVVVGGAITRPKQITEKFISAIK
ncbi:N-acetylmannosamine-6-phosphate 2-epimerase [Vibrio sp. S11_S32]|uniref:N-acetylmannosamine-6-phosphate 2-epimerase n=1 Tax=Vibrio sp. S11_S32 TaxID=2720225 RepID=UPI001680AB55|nr:N-acetylmannosamine-6-phosphate 2-epimerase [Vibrio sp. S11_S32]MBD1575760.1 N-acetylmannosamine-6-phosphate 2-epimerase [Vibrio sp. S11_S32]